MLLTRVSLALSALAFAGFGSWLLLSPHVLIAQVVSTRGFRPEYLAVALLAGAFAVLLLLVGESVFRQLRRRR